MTNCATCKHWRPFDENGTDRRRSIVNNRLGLCGGIKKTWDHNEPLPEGSLAAVDDLSGEGYLRTNEAFGCVLWESK